MKQREKKEEKQGRQVLIVLARTAFDQGGWI